MKGILLAGGSGTRLHPITKMISKQALPIYDKPMIYYPLSTLMLAEIRDIVIISTPRDINFFSELLGDGSQLGLNLNYAIQQQPKGIAEAFLIAERYIRDEHCCLVLGDNVFHGQNFRQTLTEARNFKEGARIFGYQVSVPSQYGVAGFDEAGYVSRIVEKPQELISHWAVPGLYFYDSQVVEITKQLQPSERGELEITAVNNAYMEQGLLHLTKLSRGMAWLDTGTVDGMMEAQAYVASIQKRQGLAISCVEEIAYRLGFIDVHQLWKLGAELKNSEYGKYILRIAEQGEARRPQDKQIVPSESGLEVHKG